jgi:hypothetical protein
MMERALTRLAVAIGAVIWLSRVAFSQSERSKLGAALQALDSVKD